MTTVIRTRMPLETLKMSQQSAGPRRSKRNGEYTDNDGDFSFSRAKRVKTQAAPTTEPVPLGSSTKKDGRMGTKARDDDEGVVVKKSRTRKSGAVALQTDSDAIQQPKRRRSTRLSGQGTQNATQSHAIDPNSSGLEGVDILRGAEESQPSIVETSQATMISLPFSDTPVINRNKELRKKGGSQRRSSLGMRGRRASSLIDNGHSALPHREVETHDFYKHIEADGPSEPRRMKQLLTWAGERALGEKPSHGKDSAAELAARVITEQLLKDFGNKSEFSDWFNREEVVPQTKIIKDPHPNNIQAEEKIVELEARMKILKAERDQWTSLSKSRAEIPPIVTSNVNAIHPTDINASLLDPEQALILAKITHSPALFTRTNAQERLRKLHSSLEFKVDQFADGVHKIEQYQETVGRVADKILRVCAGKLQERDKKQKERVGTRDLPIQEVLRSLSRILPDSGGSR